MASDWLGVCIAPGFTMFDESPDWVRLDDRSLDAGLRVGEIRIRRGKQSVFEQTGTGECEVQFVDINGVLDPTNASSPLYGELLSVPFAVAIRNPVTDEWWPMYRGVVDNAGFGVGRSMVKLDTGIVAVDMLDYFANFELIPGLAGFSNAQLNGQGYVFYEDAGFDERLNAVMGDAQVPAGLTSIFTGNIICAESTYSSGDRVLQAVQEACDAEFPTVASYYVDKRGLFQAHGRYARFDPDTVSASATNWIFHRLKAGDIAAALADPGAGGTAKLQEPFGFDLDRKMIRNAALAYPQGADQSDLSDYIFTDETSRARHGTVTWTSPNMQVAEETTIGLTAKEFCQLVAQYMIENYSTPIPRISQATLGTEHPDLDFADASWDTICKGDISDILGITFDNPGAGGFENVDHFIEGLSITIRPGPGTLDDSFPFIKWTADLSPAAHWSSSPFGAIPT